LYQTKEDIVFRQLLSAFGYYYRYQKLTLREYFVQTLLMVVGIAGATLFLLQYLFPFSFTSTDFMMGGAFLLGLLLVKLLCMKIYFSCFYGKRANIILSQYTRLVGVTGLATFFYFIFLRFTPEFTHVVWFILFLLTILFVIISYCYLLFKYFFGRIGLILHFILYLCALEILPVLVIRKMIMEMALLTQ
jgi:hypothetical protein